jgi:hypothetical protein
MPAKPHDAMVLLDGLANNLNLLMERLFYNLGPQVRYFGGGAGSLSLQQQPCLFTNEGVFQDAALLCFLEHRLSLGAAHGWQPLQGPLVATRTTGNLVHELNWQPAYEVYLQAIRPFLQELNLEYDAEHFFEVAKNFPLGIEQGGEELLVRDPIMVAEEGGLLCVGEVPENSMVYIMQGNRDQLKEATATAAATATATLPEESAPVACCVAHCVSRQLYWEDAFHSELEALNQALIAHPQFQMSGLQPCGFLCLGEIFARGLTQPDFLNKSTVTAVVY